MSVYRRVTYADRCQIYAFIAAKKEVLSISRELGFHPSTIYRELKRNSTHRYHPRSAEELAHERFKCCRKKRILVGGLEALVRRKLEERWSPEEISKRLKREKYPRRVSHQTIYRFIRERPSERPKWERSLRRYYKKGPPRRKKRARLPWMLPIAERPKVVEKRKRYGDWERDTMYGKNRRMMLVCSERKSRLVKIARLKEPLSLNVTAQTKELLGAASYRPLKSITNDNGGELLDGFSFEVPVYYCEPRKPQQRGTVENTIGLLRQYMPKASDLSVLTEEEIQKIEDELNHRPRKCLDWRTPYEVFFDKSIALAM